MMLLLPLLPLIPAGVVLAPSLLQSKPYALDSKPYNPESDPASRLHQLLHLCPGQEGGSIMCKLEVVLADDDVLCGNLRNG